MCQIHITPNYLFFKEDFTAGKPLLETLQTETLNMQVWANAACLIANLATSAEDQVGDFVEGFYTFKCANYAYQIFI